MPTPAYMPQVSPEHRKEPEYLDTKEGQAENMRRTRQSARKHRTGHNRRIRA